MQGIVKVEWKDKKADKIYITNWGCCADYVVTNKIYQLKYQKSTPSFKKIYQSASVLREKKPSDLLENPIRFEILNDDYKIRYAPVFDDSTLNEWDLIIDTVAHTAIEGKGTGTVIGRLEKGTTGTAIGKKEDKSGRVWWYVEIDEKFIPKDKVVYFEDNFPTKIVGWISSRFVKTL